MYTQPEVTRMAKALSRELGKLGVTLKHTQAMELVAKVEGSRSLAAHQAKTRGLKPDAERLAAEHAASMLFVTTGRYGADAQGLLEEIDAAYALGATEGSRAVERALYAIFETAGAPQVQPHVEAMYRRDQLSELFARFKADSMRLVDRTLSESRQLAARSEVLYQGVLVDWELVEGMPMEDLTAEQLREFAVTVRKDGAALSVEVALPHSAPGDLDGTDQLRVSIEVNKGKPCAHLSSEVYDDVHLSAFGAAEGLLLRYDEAPEPAMSSFSAKVGAQLLVESSWAAQAQSGE